MYINSENSQALQSKEMIANGLLSLMKIYPYDDITITQICREAKVVRQTFYRNFEFKVDILEFYFDKIFEQYIENHFETEIDMYDQLKSFFEYLVEYKDFLLLIEKNNLFFLLNKTLAKNISNFTKVPTLMKIINESKQGVYVLDFITSTVYSILSIWVKNNFEENSEMLAGMAKIFLSGLEKQRFNM